MKLLWPLLLANLVLLRAAAQPRPAFRPLQLFQQRRVNKNAVMCSADSILIYNDCRICVCPRPNRQAKCFRKSCDLRTKDSGQCPQAILRMDDNKLCPGAPNPACRTDNDCPNQQLCCFDFCRGQTCVTPVALEPGMNGHRGRGFP